MKEFQFTFDNLKLQYQIALDTGYQFMNCLEYAKCIEYKEDRPALAIVNRVDVDYSIKKADRLRQIFDSLSIKASFFIRLHAPEYNPFSFENYRILQNIIRSGHEIGYHSEVIDESVIWNEIAADCLRRDIDVLNRMLSIKIQGVSSHGGMTGLNNLDFWKTYTPKDFGLKYEAYDQSKGFNLFNNSFYISDSEWTQWKCYNKGQICFNDHRSFKEHITDRHSLIYLLIHSDTYFDRHFYE